MNMAVCLALQSTSQWHLSEASDILSAVCIPFTIAHCTLLHNLLRMSFNDMIFKTILLRNIHIYLLQQIYIYTIYLLRVQRSWARLYVRTEHRTRTFTCMYGGMHGMSTYRQAIMHAEIDNPSETYADQTNEGWNARQKLHASDQGRGYETFLSSPR